jgi:hypothetical protein
MSGLALPFPPEVIQRAMTDVAVEAALVQYDTTTRGHQPPGRPEETS